MDLDFNIIHIFKTNIRKGVLDSDILNVFCNNKEIEQWSIDHEDVDCVLRVVSKTLEPNDIIALVTNLGFDCEELN